MNAIQPGAESWPLFTATGRRQYGAPTTATTPRIPFLYHRFTTESWRHFFNALNDASEPSLTLIDTIKSVSESLKKFYNKENSIQRIKSLQLPDGVEFHHENVAPQNYFSGEQNSASTDRSHAYLNVGGGSANSVSVPLQEFADLIGYRNLLRSITQLGLNTEHIQQAQIALGLNALINQAR